MKFMLNLDKEKISRTDLKLEEIEMKARGQRETAKRKLEDELEGAESEVGRSYLSRGY